MATAPKPKPEQPANVTALRPREPDDLGQVVVQPINIERIQLKVIGTAPLVMNAFAEKATRQLMDQMTRPEAKRRRKTDRPPRNWEQEFKDAHHYDKAEQWVGLPSSGVRACCIDACRLAHVMMTRAKQALFLIADGWDSRDGQGLIKLDAEEPPEQTVMHVRNESGVVDLRCRPLWRKWSAIFTLHYDADWISAEHVINLVNRGGSQVGICEGRPASPNSYGMGWGTFAIVGALRPEPQAIPDPKRLLDMLDETKEGGDGNYQ